MDGTANFATIRYNTDGSVDPSFGNNGQVVTGWRCCRSRKADLRVAALGVVSRPSQSDLNSTLPMMPHYSRTERSW